MTCVVFLPCVETRLLEADQLECLCISGKDSNKLRAEREGGVPVRQGGLVPTVCVITHNGLTLEF